MSGKSPYPSSPWQHWSSIAMLVANGGIPEKSDIAAALRSATSEIDDLVRLIHTEEVHAFLNGFAASMLDDPVVEQFLGKLKAMFLRPLPIVPAVAQRYIANIIDPPKRPAHRPKRGELTDVCRQQLENRKLAQARQDVADMKALLVQHRGDEAAALAAFARTRGKSAAKQKSGITVPAAKRRYRQSALAVEADRAFLIEQFERSRINTPLKAKTLAWLRSDDYPPGRAK
jgi:hypothetical protein